MAAVAPTDALASWLAPFAPLFTGPTWRRALVLVGGAVLNRGRWSARAAARVLLALLARAFGRAGGDRPG